MAECEKHEAGCSDDEQHAIIEKYRKASETNDENMALCTTVECHAAHVANMATLEELRGAIGSHGMVGRELFREGLEVEDWVVDAAALNIIHSADIEAACPTGDRDCIIAISNEIRADDALLDLLRVVPGPDILMAAVDCQAGDQMACFEVAMLGRGRTIRNVRDEIVDVIPSGRKADIYGEENVLTERTLRDANGEIVRDIETGQYRRLDCVIVNGQCGYAVEVTSPSVDKGPQLRKELSIRNEGGTYVINPNTGELIEVENLSEVIRRD